MKQWLKRSQHYVGCSVMSKQSFKPQTINLTKQAHRLSRLKPGFLLTLIVFVSAIGFLMHSSHLINAKIQTLTAKLPQQKIKEKQTLAALLEKDSPSNPVLGILSKTVKAQDTGFSDVFSSLTDFHIPGVWIFQILVDTTQDLTRVAGYAMKSPQIYRFVDTFKLQAFFKQQTFNIFMMDTIIYGEPTDDFLTTLIEQTGKKKKGRRKKRRKKKKKGEVEAKKMSVYIFALQTKLLKPAN